MKTIRRQTLLIALLAITFYVAALPAHAQWTNTATLTASDGQALDNFGFSFAVHGDTLVIGAPGRNQFTGVAYVFTESNGIWTQVAELTASDAVTGLDFGVNVAVSGNTIVVGADAFLADVQGAAYVFVEPATGWANMTQTAKLSASDGAIGDAFGTALAVYQDTIVAGSWEHKVGSNADEGAVYVYVMPTSGWTNMTQTAELAASDGVQFSSLGISVDLKGSTLVAGSSQGAYVFEKPASGWVNGTQTAKLTASPSSNYPLGQTVAISNDEATIVAGAPGRTTNGPVGAAYIFSRPSAGWQNTTQSSEMISPSGAVRFGNAAINGPGTIIAVGAPDTTFHTTIDAGDVYMYRKPATGWQALPQANARLNSPSPQKFGAFGLPVALRATTVIAGGFQVTINGNTNQGAVYVFDRP